MSILQNRVSCEENKRLKNVSVLTVSNALVEIIVEEEDAKKHKKITVLDANMKVLKERNDTLEKKALKI